MKLKRRIFSLILICCLTFLAVNAGAQRLQKTAAPSSRKEELKNQQSEAQAIIFSALEAMGGREKLAALKSVKLSEEVINNRADDSERFEAPWWVSVLDTEEFRDLAGKRMSQELSQKSAQFEFSIAVRAANGILAQTRRTPSGLSNAWQTSADTQEWYALSPERMLFTALEAKDLTKLPDQTVHGVKHHVLSFNWRGYPLSLFISTGSGLPGAMESVKTGKFDLVQTAWGDVAWRTEFMFWKLDKSGIFYPQQWNTFRNGEQIRTNLVRSVAFNADPPAEGITIPAEAVKQFEGKANVPYADLPLKDPQNPFVQIGKEIWMIPGNWNVGVVEQGDGLVILECPQSGGYSRKVLDAVRLRFPNVPIKAVVSTTDSLWHFAGLREYAAQGIPVYALDLTVPLLQRFLAAPHKLDPDSLALRPRKAIIRPVADAMTLGTGPARLTIIPIRGQSDERMMMVYFPEQRILYGGSNDVFPDAKGVLGMTFNMPELILAVRRENLQPEKFFAIHTGLKDWNEILGIFKRDIDFVSR